MTGTDALVQDQRRYLEILKENWGYGNEQARLLTHLSAHHGQAISRSQVDAARATLTALQELTPKFVAPKVADEFLEYGKDFGQRWILFLATLCQRGDACIVREKEGFRPVLAFDFDIVVDGRKLDRPVNYALVRIHAMEGTAPPRDDARPWVIIDPRAGHGSGIGGFKSKSEVGVALREGHPVYFVIFFPRARAGPDLGRCVRGRSDFSAGNSYASSPQPQAVDHRQLPGRLGDHDPRRHASRSDGSDCNRRRTAFLLGGRERP